MLSPKRTKYRKYHRGRMRGKATRGNEISFGNFGLQALEPTWITSRQIEAARRTITRYTKRGASLWIRVFPDKTVTARAAESRMGSGKGAVDYWVAVVKPGTILFEIASVPSSILAVPDGHGRRTRRRACPQGRDDRAMWRWGGRPCPGSATRQTRHARQRLPQRLKGGPPEVGGLSRPEAAHPARIRHTSSTHHVG